MKQTQVALSDPIKSKKKLLYLVIVVCIALIVLIFSGYRLLTFKPDSSAGETEKLLIQNIKDVANTVPAQILSTNILVNQSRNNLNKAVSTINSDWSRLRGITSFSSSSINRAQLSIDDLLQYIDAYLGGQSPRDDVFSLTRRAVADVDALRSELAASDTSAGMSTEILLVIASLLVVILSLVLICWIVWVDTSKFGEDAKAQTESSQAAILRLLDELADLADGDLTVSATVTEDFTGAIADSINFTIDQLRQLVSRINNTAIQVSGAAQATRQTALHLAEASDHQAQEIAGASAAINEMAVTIDQVSANASESALVAGKSVSIANNGAKLVQNTIQGMDTIREQIQDTSKRIKRLGESSQEIGDIVSLINDIADQTNILALNAAIQASMAGDAGRGFAVVADEVQRLAERSAAATKQIETLVNTIQTDTNEAVISMEQTTSEVVTGARLAQDAGVALEEIEGVSVNLAELIQNISNAARQQASSAGHISNTMNVIQEITSQTSAGTNATAESIGQLANMAMELRDSVSDFTLPEDMEVNMDEEILASATDFAEAQQRPSPVQVGEDFSNLDTDDIDNIFELSDADEVDINKLSSSS